MFNYSTQLVRVINGSAITVSASTADSAAMVKRIAPAMLPMRLPAVSRWSLYPSCTSLSIHPCSFLSLHAASYFPLSLADECPPNQFKCLSSSLTTETLCIPQWQLCDSIPDCPDASDESSCGTFYKSFISLVVFRLGFNVNDRFGPLSLIPLLLLPQIWYSISLSLTINTLLVMDVSMTTGRTCIVS